MRLDYYIKPFFGDYQEFYTYAHGTINDDEIYARQLCGYFIKDGNQYKLISNEMENGIETLILEESGKNESFPDEENYAGKGVNIEFRQYNSFRNMPLLAIKQVNTHWDVIRYLLKDVVEVPGKGLMLTDSTELDEDRHVYVIYVTDLR